MGILTPIKQIPTLELEYLVIRIYIITLFQKLEKRQSIEESQFDNIIVKLKL